jgi:hypothetical protein
MLARGSAGAGGAAAEGRPCLRRRSACRGRGTAARGPGAGRGASGGVWGARRRGRQSRRLVLVLTPVSPVQIRVPVRLL